MSSISIVHNLATPDYWTPEEHSEFSKRFREDIRMKLLAMRARRSSEALPAVKPVTVLRSLELLEVDDFEVKGAEGADESAVKEVEDGLRYLQSVSWWKMQPSVVLAALQFKPPTTTTTTITEDLQDDEVREVKRRRL